jgi:hypothetical protein
MKARLLMTVALAASTLVGLVGLAGLAGARSPGEEPLLPEADGYRGIWYMNQPSGDEYRYKYSGGFATYPQQHLPIAWHAPQVNRTFFVYGGTVPGRQELLHMVSYYDHASGTVPRPRILLNKKTTDAHDNPTLSLDDDGYLWVFSNSHGTARPAYVHRSRKPYSIDAFEPVLTTNFSYGQPWHLSGKGFLFLHTRYAGGRGLFWMTSPDGREWSEPRPLAKVAQGHYQVSWRDGERLGTAFNYHPAKGGLNARTNLYYLETADQGRTWRTAAGQPVPTPVTEAQNPALVREYESEGLLVYLKDLQFDARGRPVILYLTSKGYASGPANDPRTLMTARWTGEQWEVRPVAPTDHNYDHGSLYLEADGTWRVIAPTDPGPQPYCTGGEMVLWVSRDEGASWKREKQLTRESRFNHTYARRPVDAHPDFYAFWADGNALESSASRLYFTDRAGARVRKLPETMTAAAQQPEAL